MHCDSDESVMARQRHGSAEQALAATQKCIKSSALRDDETVEQEGPESLKKRIVASLPVCFLPMPCQRDSCKLSHHA